MKKLILSAFVLVSITCSFAQKANVSKAEDNTLMEKPNFKEARAAIKLALEDSTTKLDPNTWYIAGLIGYTENDAFYKKALLSLPFDEDAKGNAILESYKYFLEADQLDQIPNEKGKVKSKFRKKIKSRIKEYYSTSQNLISYGAYLFDKKKDYKKAVDAWEVYLAIPKLPMMNNELPMDSTYKMIKYYSAVAAVNGELHDKAISICNDLKNDNYEGIKVYQFLYQEYMATKDTVQAINSLKEGFTKFPAEAWFLQNLINNLIFSGKTKDALIYLNTAIEKEPKMAQYRFVKGNLDESLGNLEDARLSFDKAIEIDPTMADAYAGIGRLYFNKAVKMLQVANETIKDNKLFNAEAKKAETVFKESIPFFKKATELKPTELDYKKNLKTIYYKLKMIPEYDAISKEIDAL